MYIRIIIVIISLALPIIAQVKPIKFDKLDVKGLSQGSIRCMLQDSRGFIWVGTQDGLNRFDGYNFEVFRTSNPQRPVLTNNWIESICEDAFGNIWIGTKTGLSYYNYDYDTLGSFSFEADSLNSKSVYSIIKDSRNDSLLWISISNHILAFNIFSHKYQSFQPEYFSDSYLMRVLFQDSRGNIWGGSSGLGIYKFNNSRNKFDRYYNSNDPIYPLMVDFISGIAEAPNGNLYITNGGGFGILNTVTHSYKKLGPKNAYIFCTGIAYDDKYLYVATRGDGLIQFDVTSQNLIFHKNNPSDLTSISTNVLQSILRDRSGIIWIGSNGKGISLLNQYSYKFNPVYFQKGGMELSSIRCFYEDESGTLWIGGYHGLVEYNSKSQKHQTHYWDRGGDRIGNDNIYTIYPDLTDQTKLWLGSEGGGLVQFDKRTKEFKSINLNIDNYSPQYGHFVSTLYMDNENLLWIGSHLGLLVYHTKTKNIEVVKLGNPLEKNTNQSQVTALFEDSYSNLWVGTENMGLFQINKRDKKVVKNFRSSSSSISSNSIKSIMMDSKNRLWLGTRNGLNRFDYLSNEFETFYQGDGLPNDVIYGILEDEFGNLWLSTNYGLSKFNYADLSFENFTVTDGLQDNEFNTNAYYKNKQNKLYFGGINGYNSFFAKDIVKNTTNPQISLTDFKLSGVSVKSGITRDGRKLFEGSIYSTKTIELSYDDRIIGFEFASLDFTSPGRNQYKYMVEGITTDWIPLKNERSVTVSNLAPGNYVFRVIGSNNDGVWSANPLEINLIVKPPIWRTWWFFLIVVTLIVISIYYSYRKRVSVIEESNKLLEKTVEERTIELKRINDALLCEISERKKIEEEIKKYSDELRANNAAKDKFFSIVAHDLKSPFQGLLGYSEILNDSYDELERDEIKEYLSYIKEISKNTFTFLSNLLSWSRLQLGRFEFLPLMISLREKVNDSINLLKVNADNKSITVLNLISPTAFVHADDNMLHSVIMNLLSNAIKFSNSNGTIKFLSEQEEGFHILSIEDDGVGIREEDLNKLFNIELHHSTKGTALEEGTGLGLLLCKEMINRQGGTISVESKFGIGTTFKIKLPIYKENNEST
ncbi:MAG TPA: two-component regulator propeller domain-containing protein [Ignavibacteriaceae bacterium]|nr:two-component regulator propeller domain-containing protein [Ignavibacteriaceae bacterium]